MGSPRQVGETLAVDCYGSSVGVRYRGGASGIVKPEVSDAVGSIAYRLPLTRRNPMRLGKWRFLSQGAHVDSRLIAPIKKPPWTGGNA